MTMLKYFLREMGIFFMGRATLLETAWKSPKRNKLQACSSLMQVLSVHFCNELALVPHAQEQLGLTQPHHTGTIMVFIQGSQTFMSIDRVVLH
jgi:hypothetical protein